MTRSKEGLGSRYPDFAIVSNTRCGSTWLATALANTDPSVKVDWEVKLENYSRSSVHFPIDPLSVPERLEELTRVIAESGLLDTAVLGTKITLDASVEPFHSVRVPDRWRTLQLIGAAAPSMRFVHLTRGLCEQNQSPGGHSTRHLDSNTASSYIEGSRLLRNVILESAFSEPSRPATDHQCDPQKAFHQFMNDLGVASALSQTPRYLRVRYETLHRDFPRVLKFLDFRANHLLEDVSITKKNARSSPPSSCELGLALTSLRDLLLASIDIASMDEASRNIILDGAGALFESERLRVAEASGAADQVTGRELLVQIRRRALWKIGFRPSARP
jgi:hypothetical protein